MSDNMTDAISQEHRQRFADEGYLVARGLLDVEHDIEPFKEAYIRYLDGLADIFMGETNPDLRADFAARPFAERFAVLLGCSGGAVLDHLDPSLSPYLRDYRWRPDLPSAQTPELFRFMRNENLLDAVECLIGPEILASPGYRVNLKLAPRDLDFAAAAARACGQESPDRHGLWGLLVGAATKLHIDAAYALAGARQTNAVAAWIPMTEATLENGCLEVVPGSHRAGILSEPIPPSACENAVPLPVTPGDVIFFDYRLLHGARPNQTEDQIRWAFNIRYYPTGEPIGLVHLPSFVARSRAAPDRELRDPDLWSRMWRGALDYAATKLQPLRDVHGIDAAEAAEADAVTAHFLAKFPGHADWLRLGAVEEDSSDARSGFPIERLPVDDAASSRS